MLSEDRLYASEQIPKVRPHSNDHLPEVSHVGTPFGAQNPYEDYEFYARHPYATPEYQQHSASPYLSSPQSPGLESVNEKEGEKEVCQPRYFSEPERKRRIVCGMAMKWCAVLTALILVAIIAVAVALGVVFETRHS